MHEVHFRKPSCHATFPFENGCVGVLMYTVAIILTGVEHPSEEGSWEESDASWPQ